MAITNLGFVLYARGKTAEMELLYNEASKLHLFISRFQRPLEAVPDLEAKVSHSKRGDLISRIDVCDIHHSFND